MQDIFAYNELAHELRCFFQEKYHYLEIPSQTKFTLLSCKDPASATLFQQGQHTYPLPQSAQIQLEKALMANPQLPGVFSLSTSYRHDAHALPGRHDKVFPLFEFVTHGHFHDLRKIYKELLTFLGLPTPEYVSYADCCRRYGKTYLTPANDIDIQRELGNSVSLEYLTRAANPFWTSQAENEATFREMRLILHGLSTFSGAEHHCDSKGLKQAFLNYQQGQYAKTLFAQFGQKRVEEERDDYLMMRLIPRVSGAIGLTRLARAVKQEERALEQLPRQQRQIA